MAVCCSSHLETRKCKALPGVCGYADVVILVVERKLADRATVMRHFWGRKNMQADQRRIDRDDRTPWFICNQYSRPTYYPGRGKESPEIGAAICLESASGHGACEQWDRI